MIGVLLHKIFWKSVNLSAFTEKYSFMLACRWFDFARDSRWININRTSFAKDSMTSYSYLMYVCTHVQAEACNSVLKWIVVLKMSLMLNQIEELHWRLNASSVWRSVLGLWKRSIWVRLVNLVKAYLINPPYLNVRAPALLFLGWSKFLIFHKIIVGEYTRLTFTKNLSDYFGSLNKGGKPERDRHFFFFMLPGFSKNDCKLFSYRLCQMLLDRELPSLGTILSTTGIGLMLWSLLLLWSLQLVSIYYVNFPNCSFLYAVVCCTLPFMCQASHWIKCPWLELPTVHVHLQVHRGKKQGFGTVCMGIQKRIACLSNE